jgi:PAS domain S-box-containing protein
MSLQTKITLAVIGLTLLCLTGFLPALGWDLVAKLDSAEGVGTIVNLCKVLLILALPLATLAIGSGYVIGKRLIEAGERVEAELASRMRAERAERRFRQVIDSAPNAMLLIAPDGDIVLANQQAERLLGYDTHALCTMQVEALVPQTIRSEHRALRQQYATSPATRAMEAKRDLFVLHRTGYQVPVEIGLTPISTDEGPMVLAVLVDLTERQQAEVALRHAHDELERRVQERTSELTAINAALRAEIDGRKRAEAAQQHYAADLERSNRELDQFAYVATHDLKAPLRAIDHLAQWIAEDAGDALPDKSREDLSQLQQRVGRMARLLDSLLAYARIGRSECEIEVINLERLLQDTLALFEIPETFTVSVDVDLPTFQAPKVPIELVLRNLIGNALKHHDRTDGRLEIFGRDLGDRVELIVVDDGPGIAQEYHAQIFRIFQTLKPRDELEGCGMGLALVKKTVDHHGGTIHVESEVKQGARFRLTWPKTDTQRS